MAKKKNDEPSTCFHLFRSFVYIAQKLSIPIWEEYMELADGERFSFFHEMKSIDASKCVRDFTFFSQLIQVDQSTIYAKPTNYVWQFTSYVLALHMEEKKTI